ncbi:hypothetical protein CU103_03990 [Phyllobacterium sophorae]|uniref:Uncharacterized protein n=1 Tax=Phyllobacterium sophorae TaxID=1520277 RepID=A0A2P7BH46_9HYPH|nr:hypothetical protein CU103_03990 [Phyllobacterium sophorae]
MNFAERPQFPQSNGNSLLVVGQNQESLVATRFRVLPLNCLRRTWFHSLRMHIVGRRRLKGWRFSMKALEMQLQAGFARNPACNIFSVSLERQYA